MGRVTLIRAAALYLPLALAVLAWLWAPPTGRERAAAVLATAWSAATLYVLHLLAMAAGWWSFGVNEATFAGFPVDLYLGWAVLWAVLPALLSRYASPALVVLGAVTFDVIAMPQIGPVVLLGDRWLVGEAVAIVLCLVPGLALAKLTRTNTRPGTRALLQAIAFTVLALGVLPQAILERTSGSWTALTARPVWVTAILLQCVAALGLLGMSAVQEFATRGGGTPVPFDAPARLVASGPYAYVRNPMQFSATLVLVAWGAMLGSWWVAAAGAMAVIYGAGFAAGDEGADLERRFGERWALYTSLVRSWIPRWRPADVSALAPRATLYVAEECGPCSEVRAWFTARNPTGLEIVPAERHPSRSLSRITYDPGDGTGDVEGVAAIARALEHVHLGWALVGMFVRLPGLRQFLQLIADASGGAERQMVRYCDRPPGSAAHAGRELR
jgi:protein-S-isoprenylcysteine O-methyltransferase Ste14